MLTEFRKSINSILYERTVSPLFGTFILAWCTWNWKVIYFTIFVSEDKILGTKIDYILHQYYSIWNFFLWPSIITVALLTVIPFFSEGAFWLDSWFKSRKRNIRKKAEGKELLTFEESLKLREAMNNLEKKFVEVNENKDADIEELTTEVRDLNTRLDNKHNENSTLEGKYSELIKENNTNKKKLDDEILKFENLSTEVNKLNYECRALASNCIRLIDQNHHVLSGIVKNLVVPNELMEEAKVNTNLSTLMNFIERKINENSYEKFLIESKQEMGFDYLQLSNYSLNKLDKKVLENLIDNEYVKENNGEYSFTYKGDLLSEYIKDISTQKIKLPRLTDLKKS